MKDKKLNVQKHFTHNSSNSSLSSHNYLLLNESKKSSKVEESKEEIKKRNKNINNIKNNSNKLYIKGTLKVDKVHYLMKDEGKKLFEDINLQYIEPLEGGEEESEEQDDRAYRQYLNNIKEELNQKKENIVFIHDLGLSNNLLNVNDLFDKIKKKSKFKTRNSFLSINYRIKKDDINLDNNEQKPKKIIPKRKALGFKAIRNLFISKTDMKQYYKKGKRVLTYENRKNINNYYKNRNILLNIKERKKSVKRINSQKLFKKTKKSRVSERSLDNTFGNKKNNKIKDSLLLSKKKSKIIKENKKEDEMKKENEIKEKKNAEKKMRKLSPKNKLKKKNVVKNEPKPKFTSKYKKYLLDKNKMFRAKKATPININKYNNIDKNKSKLKSPAINSILKDISKLSQSVLTNRFQKNKDKNNKTILYDRHFGFEYWKENELRKNLCHNSTTNRKSKTYRAFYSPNKDKDAFSMISSNYSWLLNKKNGDDMLDYETDFTLGIKESLMNPYSIKWTKSMIKNGYNRKIQLINNNNHIPKIELVRVQSSTPYKKREKIIYDKSKNIDVIFRKTNDMFGRIYKNNNDVEFPVIKYF